mmetsp:Transcript_27206/g.30306  ORF Transcript_27206/g.30306 Transcript_27206/m.30306 type:complete len:165 (+) Transcript_27206:29-523(+)
MRTPRMYLWALVSNEALGMPIRHILVYLSRETTSEFKPAQETLKYCLDTLVQTEYNRNEHFDTSKCQKSANFFTEKKPIFVFDIICSLLSNMDLYQRNLTYFILVNKVLLYFQQNQRVEPSLSNWDRVIRIYTACGDHRLALMRFLMVLELLETLTWQGLLPTR